MENQNNETPQGLITNETVKAPEVAPQPTAPAKKKLSFKMNKTTLIVLIVVVVLLVIFAAGSLKSGNGILGLGKKNNVDPNAKVIVDVDVETTWGKKYGERVQDLYYGFLFDGRETNIDRFDLTFVNVDFLDAPEMLVKYKDKNDKEYLIVYYFDAKNRLKESKHFSNSDVKMLYSFELGQADWYVYIAKDNRYGTYTRLSKVVAETVNAPDIKVTNDTEVNAFSENYAISDYKLVFYEIKKESFQENFKTIYDRYYDYANEIDAHRDKLKEEYGKEEKKEYDENPYVKIGGYNLVYGDYKYEPMKTVDGREIKSSYADTIITINRDKTFTIGGKTMKYTVNGNIVTFDDNTYLKILKNDEFTYSVEGGILFKAVKPFDYAAEAEAKANANAQENDNKQENP